MRKAFQERKYKVQKILPLKSVDCKLFILCSWQGEMAQDEVRAKSHRAMYVLWKTQNFTILGDITLNNFKGKY